MVGPGRSGGQNKKRAANGNQTIGATPRNDSSPHPSSLNGVITRARHLTTNVQPSNIRQAEDRSRNPSVHELSFNSSRHASHSDGDNPNEQNSMTNQNASSRVTNEDDSQGSNMQKRKRGPTKGIGLEKIQ